MVKKKKSARKIIIISAICIIVLGVAAYFISENFMKRNFRGNSHFPDGRENFGFPNDSERKGGFPSINETTKKEITSFFETSPSSSEVEDYCNKNKEYCFYYCINTKGDNEFCKGMNNTKMSPRGEPPQ
jgi:hypothetical protein